MTPIIRLFWGPWGPTNNNPCHNNFQREVWWRTDPMPKLKLLGWRITRNILPSADEFLGRSISVEFICSICSWNLDSAVHLCINCFSSPLPYSSPPPPIKFPPFLLSPYSSAFFILWNNIIRIFKNSPTCQTLFYKLHYF